MAVCSREKIIRDFGDYWREVLEDLDKQYNATFICGVDSLLPRPIERRAAVKEWLLENTKSNYHITVGGQIFFEDENEAIAFFLAFG